MGIYERDYNRDYSPQSGFNLGGETTLTTKIVIVMFIVYAVQLFTRGPAIPIDAEGRLAHLPGGFTEFFSLDADVLKHPLRLFQLLTYGFLHDVNDFMHIVANMLGFWFLGRYVEGRYGRREYLTFFLVAIAVAGLVWVLSKFAVNRTLDSRATLVGASGGVAAVVILFALNFPHQTVLFAFFLPMPMWVAAVLLVGFDAYGALHRSDPPDRVAFTAHLGGALFALIYFKAGWRLERLLPGGKFLKHLKPRPALRVHDPEEANDTTEAQVDEILKKIQEKGRDSLTRQENRILEEASKQYQKRRK